MAFEIRTAERKKAKLKLGISGPSGAGKTYSSLLMAFGITGDWTKVTLIDTENGSGELYSSLGRYNVIPFQPPYDPRRYVEAIGVAIKSGAEVIVIDSISHEWDGKGGCLDIQTRLGGKYQDWAKVTPLHNSFVEAILQSPAHVIVTTRKKQDYEMTKESNGKTKVEKVGLKEIQRDGFEYELTINFNVDIGHFATASKDRTGLFMPRGPFEITRETGQELIAWANSGALEVAAEPEKKQEASTSPKTSEKPSAPSTSTNGFASTANASSTNTTQAGATTQNGQTHSQTKTNTPPQGSSTASPATTTKLSGADEIKAAIRRESLRLHWSAGDFMDYAKISFDKAPKDLTEPELTQSLEFMCAQPNPVPKAAADGK